MSMWSIHIDHHFSGSKFPGISSIAEQLLKLKHTNHREWEIRQQIRSDSTQDPASQLYQSTPIESVNHCSCASLNDEEQTTLTLRPRKS